MKEPIVGLAAVALGLIDHFHAWGAVGWSLLAVLCVGSAAGMLA